MKNHTRQSIVDAAARLFYQKGYNNTGINELIEEAGIVKSTLYQHFRSKEEIAIAYISQANELFFNGLQNYLSKKTRTQERLLGIFLFLKENVQQENWCGCPFFNIISEIPPTSAITHEVYLHKKAMKELFVNETSSMVKGDISLALTLFLLFEGALIDSKIFKSHEPITQAIDAAILLLEI